MRVLHLFANHRWTGPAEPALTLAARLRDEHGVDVAFACSPLTSSGHNQIIDEARARGLEPVLTMRLAKHATPWGNFRDRQALAAYLRARPASLIHCHLDNDHRIAAPVAAKLGIPLIRSSYEGMGFIRPGRQRAFVRTAGHIIEPSAIARDHDEQTYHLPPDRLTVVPNAIDTERFDASRALPPMHERFGLPEDAFVVGIVARMQAHRRYEDFWDAIALLARESPRVHALVVGRGTHPDRIAYAPVRERGIGERVHYAGHISGDEYVGTLAAMDCKVYLVPGSDGTCRAVREALAMGVPVVAADRGMLREIVVHGETGFVCDGRPEALASAIRTMLDGASRHAGLRAAAAADARARFSLSAQARRVKQVYDHVLAG